MLRITAWPDSDLMAASGLRLNRRRLRTSDIGLDMPGCSATGTFVAWPRPAGVPAWAMHVDPNAALQDRRRRIHGGLRPLLGSLSTDEPSAVHALIREGDVGLIKDACKPLVARALASWPGTLAAEIPPPPRRCPINSLRPLPTASACRMTTGKPPETGSILRGHEFSLRRQS
jgi:hypothetical protein